VNDPQTTDSVEATLPVQPAPKRGGLGLAEWLSIVQLLALIVGACWTAFLYMKFDARDKTLAQEKSEIELRKLKAAPVRFEQNIAVWQYKREQELPQQQQLGVDYYYAITNTTNQRIKIAMVVGHAFVLPPRDLKTADAVEVPQVSLAKDSPWRRTVSRAHLGDGEELENGIVKSAQGDTFVPTRGGGGTGEVEPGDTNWGTINLIVRPQASDYIGFMLDAYVRFEDGSTRWVGSSQSARLAPGNYGVTKAAGRDASEEVKK
jgi:hypothetical protein